MTDTPDPSLSPSPHLVPVVAVLAAAAVFGGFWLLGDELDQGATQNRAWLLALAGSTLGVGSLLAGERRLGGRPLNWPLFLGAAAVVGGLFVVLATFAPGAN